MTFDFLSELNSSAHLTLKLFIRNMKHFMTYFGFTAILVASSISAFAHDLHDGLRHWEIPSKDPDRIILTFHGDPSTSRAVTWRTEKSITKAKAEIAEIQDNSKFQESAVSFDAVTEPFDLGEHKGNKSLIVHNHSVVFKELKPDTTYLYRVGDGKKYWSEWIQFKTARPGYGKSQFVYFGDAQNDVLNHWSRVIRMAYKTAPEASFAVHAGDLINLAHRDHEWAQWFKAGGFIHSQWTAIPVAGNHEFMPPGRDIPRKLSIQWRPQFTLPVEKQLDSSLHESVYTVDYQDIRIIVLNSNEKLEMQTKYLEEKLKDCDAKWKIVTCHHSIFSPASGRDFRFGREVWKPIIDKYEVDLVLNGHDHTYARGHVPIREKSGDSNKMGAVYVTSVSGPKQYSLDPKQLKSYQTDGYVSNKTGEQTQFFQVITVENNSLEYIAYTASGKKYDRFVIQKDFSTGKKSLKD